MSMNPTTTDSCQSEIEELRRQLEEAEATLAAIRSGEVDAIVVSDHGDPRIYTLEGADHPYRVFVEAMQQGAVTVGADGTILFANASFLEMVKQPYEKVIGANIGDFFRPSHRALLQAPFPRGRSGGGRTNSRSAPAKPNCPCLCR